MIIPDVNLLLYAHNEDSSLYLKASTWWTNIISKEMSLGLPWIIIVAFIRLITSQSVLPHPTSSDQAIDIVNSWLELSNVQVIEPGRKHLNILREILKQGNATSRLTTDAHIAALAIEYSAEIHSNDLDFARFSGLKFHNPLK